MLTFLKKEEKENIILFIHGFNGGKETWKSGMDPSLFIQYLLLEEKIKDHYDIALFDYFAKVTDAFQKAGVFKQLFDASAKVQKNLSIDDLSDLLLSEVDITLADYKRIVLVGHSMGGLVSKAYILKAIKKQSRVQLYISIAVPHKGVKLADLGKIIFNSPQIEDLRPLEEYNNKISSEWIAQSEKLPKTIYHQGKLDDVVSQASSVGFDARKDIEVVYSEHGHTSIIRPKSPNDVVVNSTRKALIALIESPLASSPEIKLANFKSKEMEPLSSASMLASIVGYLAKKVKDDKSITGFLSDFTGATVAWLRPLFLTNDQDPKPKEFIQDLIDDPVDEIGLNRQGVLNTLQKALQKDDTGMVLAYIQEMYEVINAKKEQGEDVGAGSGITVNGDGNIVFGSNNSGNTFNINTNNRFNSSGNSTNPTNQAKQDSGESTDN